MVVEFRLAQHPSSPMRLEYGGRVVLIEITATVLEPARCTQAELIAWVETIAQWREPAGWLIEDHPIVGTLWSHSHGPLTLVDQVARVLHHLGLHVVNWPPYHWP
jgi:hypothetical protein